jgi:antitoxin MazE
MNVKVQKWGNSLAVRIPRSFAREARVSEGVSVDMSVTKGGALVLVPPRRKAYALADLLDGVKRGNLHPEESSGPARGRESW